MNFFAQTVRKHIQRQISRYRSETPQGQKMIFMVPTMPEKNLLAVADAIANACLKDTTLVLILKIAATLTDGWTPEGQRLVQARGWQDERGNLTFYRNTPATPGKCTVVVLCGFDQVTDSAGLADFHTCDPDLIWRVDMQQSFKNWMKNKLRQVGLTDYSENDLVYFDRILKLLLTCGRGDLLQISEWLRDLDLNQAGDVADVPRIMLANLRAFDLPVLTRFPLHQKRKSFSLYINKSAEFFNYTMFLDANRRDKALKAVDALLNKILAGEEPGIAIDDEDIRGPYGVGEEFLEGLKKYIADDDPIERDRLLQCDFVVIWDKILKFKERRKRERRETVRKLSGGPIDVLLTACWMSLRDFYIEHKDENEPIISSIVITSDRFKHDIDSEDSDDIADNSELARQYLTRLLGGIDPFLSQHVNLHNADGSEIVFRSEILSAEMNCRYSKNAEPALEFSVTISSVNTDPLRRKFSWRLPEHHMYRLATDLLYKARKAIKGLTDIHKLPVYHIPYFEELLQTISDEEIRLILLNAIRDEHEKSGIMTNLLGGEWGHMDDPLSDQLKILAEKYDLFIDQAASSGLFAALFEFPSAWLELRQAYVDAFDAALALPEISQSSLAGMLIRAFLFIKQRQPDLGDTWYADPFEQAAIATILHPAVVEMLEAQAIYLTRCFNYVVNQELGRGPEKHSFKLHVWKTYVDLADIQSPLVGLLGNEQLNLDANVRGRELIHLIGSIDDHETSLSTRLLLQYDEASGEDISLSDTELFRETSESRLMLRLMLDYFDLHPHARDGLSVAIFRNKDIQPVIAAVHAYLETLARKPTGSQPNKRYVLCEERNRPYTISITLFTESNDETDVSLWVQQWRERWEAAETENKYALYRRCRFSLAHRIIENDKHNRKFQKLLSEQFEADLAFFYDFICRGSEINRFETVEPFDVRSRELKFPILEKACCTINNPAERYRRKRVITNRQFILGARHASLLHSLQSGTRQNGTIVVGSGDFTPWRGVMDTLHTKVEWVICIDPNIDERLIKTPLSKRNKEREIIGFGSGVGSHGKDNYTISTERFSLADIHYRLREAIQSLYGAGAGWGVTECDAVAQKVLQIAPQLSGLSLVRATGVGDEYIRDFMAYAITRKMLRPHNPLLCEFLVSLDAYRHWFDFSEDRRRPDLLWIQVNLNDDRRFQIKMHLIECKLAEQITGYIEKAKRQIDNGLKVLSNAFAPIMDNDGSTLEDEHPDRRYWWMQLHRLIASKTEVNNTQYPNVLAALERLAEGDFEISWAASVFAFQINKEDKIERIAYWMPRAEPAITAQVYTIGGSFVSKLLAASEDMEIDWNTFSDQGQELIVDDEDIQLGFDDDYPPWNYEESEEESGEDFGETIGIDSSPPAEAVSITGANSLDSSDRQGDVGQSPDVVAPQPGPKSSKEDIAVTLAVDQIDETADKRLGEVGRIFLGRTVNSNQPVYWEFFHPDLVNRHMLIFGSSGQGKTYAIQCILCEMSKFKQNSLIIDYTNGFLPKHLEPTTNQILQPKQHVIKNDPLPINPFIPQEADAGGIFIKENSNAVAKRIAGLFDSVYGLGHQQYSILHRAVMDGVESLKEEMNLNHMLALIEDMAENKKYKTYAQSLANKLRPFVLDKPFASGEKGFNWDHLFQKKHPLCNIFQLAGMDMKSSRLVTEFILWDLYGYFQSKGKKTNPKVIVLDEVQNLDHQEGSPLSKYLREGRKFGISLILATQTMSNMKRDQRDRMFQAEHKLFFKPADTELKAFADIAALATQQRADDWVRKLSSLTKGECYSIGKSITPDGQRLVTRALKIRITALEKRSFHE
jgi:DNA phosphorothioation-dependent restriction protein DptH